MVCEKAAAEKSKRENKRNSLFRGIGTSICLFLIIARGLLVNYDSKKIPLWDYTKYSNFSK
jgi:hypothetical protein